MSNLTDALLKSGGKGSGDSADSGSVEGIPREWLQTIRKKASAFAKKLSLMAAQYRDADTAASLKLSDPELEILGGLARGRTGEEIAGDMKISVNMFNSFLRSVFTRLGAVNRADAVRIAREKGLL
ncbi:MAG: helix-turn-helix transcriptional regulator, partial [Treponema sp.]|jgi:LuxR family maltose regulon positive regulatory protein|nr:helix-turn-helix transcriptional regulator [Treponema sp.]